MIKEIEDDGEGKKGQEKGKDYLSQRDKKMSLDREEIDVVQR